MQDQGVIAPSMKADFNFIDESRVTFSRPYVEYDLPEGGRRLFKRAEGYEVAIVPGEFADCEGTPTGALPGKRVTGKASCPHPTCLAVVSGQQ